MPTLKDLHTDFLEELEIGQGRSAKTVENYDHYLQRFYQQHEIKKISDITLDTVRAFRRGLNEGFKVSPATQNYHLIALRQFLKYLARRDVSALAPEKIGLAKLAERDIDVLYPEELDALFKAADPSNKSSAPAVGGAEHGTRGVRITNHESRLPAVALAKAGMSKLRDHALLQTLFSTGMRISEAVRLDRDDVPRAVNEIPIRGKGNKVRVVFLSDAAQAAIKAYTAERHDADPALFIRHTKSAVGDAHSRRLTPRSIQRLIKKYAVLAGLTKNITPHTLRHSYATDLLSNGADVRQVQQLLGHASITTTQIYTHLTDAHLRDVHQKFHRRRGSESRITNHE